MPQDSEVPVQLPLNLAGWPCQHPLPTVAQPGRGFALTKNGLLQDQRAIRFEGHIEVWKDRNHLLETNIAEGPVAEDAIVLAVADVPADVLQI